MDSDSSGAGCALHFTRFTAAFKLQDKPRTPAKTLDHAARSRSTCLRYVYEGTSTAKVANNNIGPKCEELLIRRSWHDVLENHQGWRLLKCGFTIPGVLGERCKREALAQAGVAAAAKAYGL